MRQLGQDAVDDLGSVGQQIIARRIDGGAMRLVSLLYEPNKWRWRGGVCRSAKSPRVVRGLDSHVQIPEAFSEIVRVCAIGCFAVNDQPIFKLGAGQNHPVWPHFAFDVGGSVMPKNCAFPDALGFEDHSGDWVATRRRRHVSDLAHFFGLHWDAPACFNLCKKGFAFLAPAVDAVGQLDVIGLKCRRLKNGRVPSRADFHCWRWCAVFAPGIAVCRPVVGGRLVFEDFQPAGADCGVRVVLRISNGLDVQSDCSKKLRFTL